MPLALNFRRGGWPRHLCAAAVAPLVLFLFRRLTVDASFLLARTLAVQVLLVLLVLLVFPHTFVRFALARAWCRLRVRDPVRRGWQGRRCCFGTGCQRLPMPSLAAKLLLLRRCLCLGPTAALARVPLLPGKAVHIPVRMFQRPQRTRNNQSIQKFSEIRVGPPGGFPVLRGDFQSMMYFSGCPVCLGNFNKTRAPKENTAQHVIGRQI